MYVDLIVKCPLCHKRIDWATDCWRAATFTASAVHALCFVALLVIEDAPSMSDEAVKDAVNADAELYCVNLCENPEHGYDPSLDG